MKYKKGDKILLAAEISEVYKDEVFPYAIDIHVGDNQLIDDYACTEDAIVSLINTDTAIIPLDKHCSCYGYVLSNHPVCSGTKELDPCDCGGDQSKCSFYEEVRDRAKAHIYTIAESSDKGTIVTADMYHAVLKDLIELEFWQFLAIFHWSDYEAPLNKTGCLEAVIKRYTPKEVVDAYEEWKFKTTINVGDVIYFNADKKEYLITNIIRNDKFVTYHMIAKDCCVSTVTYQNTLNVMPSDAYKKIRSNENIKSYLYKEEV